MLAPETVGRTASSLRRAIRVRGTLPVRDPFRIAAVVPKSLRIHEAASKFRTGNHAAIVAAENPISVSRQSPISGIQDEVWKNSCDFQKLPRSVQSRNQEQRSGRSVVEAREVGFVVGKNVKGIEVVRRLAKRLQCRPRSVTLKRRK